MRVTGKTVADYPPLLAEWDEEKNGVAASAVRAGSNKLFWWCCVHGHEFQKSPNGRTNNHRETGGVGKCGQCHRDTLTTWTWDLIVQRARVVCDKHGFLPPAARFQESGDAALVSALYAMGKTWGDLRDALDSHSGTSFVESRNGIRWRSHPEASLSNFLYARGVDHKIGQRYGADYEEFSGRSYGFYDLHFKASDGAWINVEIWGEKPNGHAEGDYAAKRFIKEIYNGERGGFLGIEFRDCYNDDRLTEVLRPYIGVIEPSIFDKPTDKLLPTTHWSNADELLDVCRRIADQQPDGKFPPEDWLRKRGRHKSRVGEAYNTLAIYCRTWLGGVRNVRRLLGQAHYSTTRWTRQEALDELRSWLVKYGKTPGAIFARARRGKLTLTVAELNRAARIRSAIRVHIGSVEVACDEIGARPPRRMGAHRQSDPELARRRRARGA